VLDITYVYKKAAQSYESRTRNSADS